MPRAANARAAGGFEMADILLVVEGSGGDFYPFLEIRKELLARGHGVKVLGSPMKEFEPTLRRACPDFVQLLGEKPQTYQGWLAEHGQADSARSRFLYAAAQSVTACRVILAHCRTADTLPVAMFSLHVAAQMAADRLGRRYLPVFSGPHMLKVAMTVFEAFAPYHKYLNVLRKSFGLGPVEDWETWMKSPGRGLGVWPEWFAGTEPDDLFPVTHAGFIENAEAETGELPADLLSFLEEGEPPVLITHGTTRPELDGYFESAVEGCRFAGMRCVVVTTQADLLPASLPEGVRHYERLPFADLMPRTKAVIHHGGIGTAAQALAAGVPQLILPFRHDRPDNAERLKRYGVADWLPPIFWRAEAVAKSLRALATSPSVRESCAVARGKHKRRQSIINACDAIEAAARPAPYSGRDAAALGKVLQAV
ncbi:MAG TPA: nucleotide disphospho-sugar-binding domain-containing protein [Pyrinomonadaceae bacterium]